MSIGSKSHKLSLPSGTVFGEQIKVKRDNLGSFIAYLIDREEVYTHTFSELWFDIGSIDVYQLIQHLTESAALI